MHLLAIDPGPADSGYALLTVDGLRTTHQRSGKMPSTFETYRALGVASMNAVIVERPRGMAFAPYRVPGLLDTANVAGGMAWLARWWGVRVEELSAQEVRKLLCGKANASDDDVEQVIRAHVAQVPKQTNEHARDAIAVGLVGAWIIAGRISRPAPKAKQPKKRSSRRAA